MQNIPICIRGPFRNAMRMALEEITVPGDFVRQERGWKLFMLLPRLFFHRPARCGLISRKKLEEMFADFPRGEWMTLLEGSRKCTEAAATAHRRRRRRVQGNNIEKRAARFTSERRCVGRGRHHIGLRFASSRCPSTWSRRQKWCGSPDRPKNKRGHVPRVFWARATSTFGGRGDRGGWHMVRGNKGIPQRLGDRARTQRNSSDEEARRTGLANAMGRHSGVRSGSRGCFVLVGFDPFPWRGWQCSCST